MKNIIKICIIWASIYSSLLSAENLSKNKKIIAIESFMVANECSNYEKIEGKEYCVKRSSITLNSCGRRSDWPCMEENGCLIIDKFTLKN
jgi:hypothetical protein